MDDGELAAFDGSEDAILLRVVEATKTKPRNERAEVVLRNAVFGRELVRLRLHITVALELTCPSRLIAEEEVASSYSYQATPPAAAPVAPVVPSFTAVPAAPVPPAAPAAPEEPKAPKGPSKFASYLGDITRKLKGILIDDFDDKQY